MAKIDLFYTLKLNTSDIYEQIAKNGCVETDFKTAKNAGWVVALGCIQEVSLHLHYMERKHEKTLLLYCTRK